MKNSDLVNKVEFDVVETLLQSHGVRVMILLAWVLIIPLTSRVFEVCVLAWSRVQPAFTQPQQQKTNMAASLVHSRPSHDSPCASF